MLRLFILAGDRETAVTACGGCVRMTSVSLVGPDRGKSAVHWHHQAFSAMSQLKKVACPGKGKKSTGPSEHTLPGLFLMGETGSYHQHCRGNEAPQQAALVTPSFTNYFYLPETTPR
mmetsp:Transcript_6158/g.10510  ORF Transcript_6158/g.10510 Transcript_6158/m.10510 type:complete len:117 (-) Transcript_6158:416-766(-)